MSACREPGPVDPGSEFSGADTSFLDHLDPLPFPARARALSRHARTLSDQEYRSVFAVLNSGTADERHIALHMAVVRRDIAAIERALADATQRRRALSAAIRLPVSDDALGALVRQAALRDRKRVYGVLRKSRRRNLADALVATVHDLWGRGDVAELLPACSPEVVRLWLPSVNPSASVLHRLARSAPAALGEFLTAGLLPGPVPHNWTRRYQGVLRVLARRSPEVVTQLFRNSPLTGHAARDSEVLAALLREPDVILDKQTWPAARNRDVVVSRSARQAIGRLTADQAARLLNCFGDGSVKGRLLAAVPRDRRRAVVDLAYPDGYRFARLTPEELRLLPDPDRIELVNTALSQRERDSRRWPDIELRAVLAYEQAAEPLWESTASHRYQERQQAWPALLKCAAWHGERRQFASVVSHAERAWNDQDLVRNAALHPLADAPAGLLSAVPVASLRNAIMAARDSRDATRETFALLARWLTRSLADALRHQRGARAQELQELLPRLHTDERSPGSPALANGLARDSADQLWHGVRSSVLRDVQAGRFAAAVRIASLLGKHLPSVAELDALIGEIARTPGRSTEAEKAARLWITPASTREQRLEQLVQDVPERALSDGVWQVVVTRRTDLLDRLLELDTCLPEVAPSWRGRWTGRQRAAAERRAIAVAGDPEAGVHNRKAATGWIHDPTVLRELADTAAQPVAAAALESVASSCPEQALPVLLQHADTARSRLARAAVRALGVARELLPDGEVVEALWPVLVQQRGTVGAAKEAARLLSRTRPVGSLDMLKQAWTRAAHRDVQAAAAEALASFLGDDTTIADLVADALRRDSAIRDAVLRGPDALAPYQRPVFARILGDVLTSDHTAAINDVLAVYHEYWQYAPETIANLEHVLTPDSSFETFEGALRALRQATEVENAAALWSRVVGGLVATAESADPRRAANATFRLPLLARSVHTGPETERGRAWRRVLADGCRSAGLHAEAIPLLRDMAHASLAHNADTALWDELITAVDERPHRWARRGSRHTFAKPIPEFAGAVVDHLLSRNGSVPALLAIEVINNGVRHLGPTEPLRDQFRALLEHPDPDVRESARSSRTSW